MIHALKCRMFDYLKFSKKNVQIEYKKYDKGGDRNLSDHFEADFLM